LQGTGKETGWLPQLCDELGDLGSNVK
jgi:hypothetical protein